MPLCIDTVQTSCRNASLCRVFQRLKSVGVAVNMHGNSSLYYGVSETLMDSRPIADLLVLEIERGTLALHHFLSSNCFDCRGMVSLSR